METARCGGHLWDDAGRVVGAEFLVADAAGPRAHGVVGRFEGDGFEAGGVVRADGGGDDEEEGGSWGTDAEGTLGPDDCGALYKLHVSIARVLSA